MSPARWLSWTLLATFGFAGAQEPAPDARGWSAGTPAKGAATVLGPLEGAPTLELPAAFARTLKRPTLLVYFSPTCPHCQVVAPELAALGHRLGKRAEVRLVATSSSTPEQIEAFKRAYGVDLAIDIDADRAIGDAMGARATPSALLVEPARKGEPLKVSGVWYPYMPGSDTLVEMRLAQDPWSVFAPGEYQGNAVCAACHVEEMDSWLLTFHSVAWGALAKGDHQVDPACVSCHVTGAGAATGWAGDQRSPLVEVGCEACHGPGGPHDGERVDAAQACGTCHDADHTIAFSYEKGLPLLDHFRSTRLDDLGWMQARRALIGGEAPRTLLGFPEGDSVGVAACEPCHAAEVRAWSASPHANALKTLAAVPPKASEGATEPAAPTDHRGEVACVRCHATPQRVGGLPAAELQGFREDEGVGCEACHGSGAAHVAAEGGTDNIQGLGASCPVCVLEAMCTSCHNKEWDPGWLLDPRIASVKAAHGQ